MTDGMPVTPAAILTGGSHLALTIYDGNNQLVSGSGASLSITNIDPSQTVGSQLGLFNDQADYLAFSSFGSTYSVSALRRTQGITALKKLIISTGIAKDLDFQTGSVVSLRILNVVANLPGWGVNVSFDGTNFNLDDVSKPAWCLLPDYRNGTTGFTLRYFPIQANPATSFKDIYVGNPDGTMSIKGPASAATSPTILSGNVNDYSPGIGGFQRWSSTASENVTGMVAGQDGERREIWNVGAQNIVIQNQNAGSAAANRFLTTTGADLTLAANKCAVAVYDLAATRWRVVLLP